MKYSALILLASLGSSAFADVKASATTPALPHISTIDEYWEALQIGEGENVVHSVDTTIDVLFYSPEWNILWARQDGKATYLHTGASHFKFKTGDRARLSGTIVPSEGFDSQRIQAQIVAERAFEKPINITDHVEKPKAFDLKRVVLEAYVHQSNSFDETHLGLDLVAKNRWVELRIRHDINTPIPQLKGRFIRVEGLLVISQESSQKQPELTLWTEGFNQISLARDLEKHRSDVSTLSISELEDAPREQLVKLETVVYKHRKGEDITLRDESGQIVIETELNYELDTGDMVEVTGYPSPHGAGWTLVDAVLKKGIQPKANIGELANRLLLQYRAAEQVLSMTPEELEEGHHAQLTGVVTYSDPENQYFYLQDSTSGIRIDTRYCYSPEIKLGDAIAVVGTPAAGPFAPLVYAKHLLLRGDAELPQPIRASYEDAISGGLDSQWVEMSGYIETYIRESDGTRLLLSTAQGNFEAVIKGEHPDSRVLVGSTVKLRGILSTEANERQQLQSILFVVPEDGYAQVQGTSSEDPFELPLSSIASFRRFQPFSEINKYRKTKGTVVHYKDEQTLFLIDGEDVLRVLCHSELDLPPNTLVEVTGLPQYTKTGIYLRNAKIRKVGVGPSPIPNELDLNNSPLSNEMDGRLVEIEGHILNVTSYGGDVRLIVSKGGSSIEAVGTREEFASLLPDLKSGATVALRGAYYIVYDEYSHPEKASILLRQKSDLRIVKTAPWWTPKKTLSLVFLLLLAGIGGGVWTILLRRRVGHQTRLIREKVETEAMLESQNREIVSNTSDFIYTIDFEGRFLTFNEAGLRITGYSRSEIEKLTVFDFLDTRISRLVRRILETRRSVPNGSIEMTLRRKDGSTLWVTANFGLIRNGDKPVAAFGVLHDIDASMQAKAELTRAKEAAEENTQAKSAFLATMSHELRTPMNGIIGMTDLLLELDIDSQTREYGETIRDSASSLLILLNDILDLSKAEAGKLTIDPHPFNLEECLRQTLTLLHTTAQAKGIELKEDYPAALPSSLNGDAGRLRQVLLNLVGNAVKFTEQGHVSLSVIQIDSDDPASLKFKFSIKDTGIGIPESAQKKLFQPFVQADNSHSRKFGGTGLGLKISQEIVNLFGGEIGLESEEGKGSVFWFTAHFEKLAHEPEPKKATTRRSKVSKTPMWNGPALSVLVAEDMPINQKVTMKQLANMGIKADLVKDGFEVLEAVKEKSYDIIFMDCQMPGMDGLQATIELRKDSKNDSIHIVALTANAMQGDKERCMQLGMNGYVTKPTKPKLLYEAMLQSLENPNLKQ